VTPPDKVTHPSTDRKGIRPVKTEKKHTPLIPKDLLSEQVGESKLREPENSDLSGKRQSKHYYFNLAFQIFFRNINLVAENLKLPTHFASKITHCRPSM